MNSASHYPEWFVTFTNSAKGSEAAELCLTLPRYFRTSHNIDKYSDDEMRYTGNVWGEELFHHQSRVFKLLYDDTQRNKFDVGTAQCLYSIYQYALAHN